MKILTQVMHAISRNDTEKLTTILSNNQHQIASLDFSQAFSHCVQQSQQECLKVLASQEALKETTTKALNFAALMGRDREVAILIPFSDPKTRNSHAFRSALGTKHKKCVTLLIPVSDVTVEDCFALECALFYQWNDVVDILWPLSDPKKVLARLSGNDQAAGDVRVIECIQQRLAQEQKQVIEAHIDITDKHALKKRM